MFLAKRSGTRSMVSLAVTGAVVAGATVVAASPARAVEVYPRPFDNKVTISGHAFGHGHGMSQWGAYGAAKVAGLSWQNILAFYYPGTTRVNLGNPNIRVRLDVVGSGNLNVSNASGLRLAGVALPAPATGITAFRARSLTAVGRMQVDALSATGWHPYAASASPAVFSSASGSVSVLLASGARRLYRGSISGNRKTATTVTTVSSLPMESYLRAVVPAEMPASWHPNALGAQAVAARSYANYDRTHAPAGRVYDTCDTTSCQMYSGIPAEYASSSAAVVATAGQTLTYGGAAAFTQFSAANGGWSSSGGKPYLVAKADPYDGAIPNNANSWTSTITTARIQARWPSIGTYTRLRILTRDGNGAWGGRVLTAAVDGTAGSVSVTGATIRSSFGLMSDWFIPTNGATVPTVPTVPTVRSAPSFPRDFTGDHKADVLAVVASTGALRRYAGNGAGGWGPTTVVGNGFGTFSKVLTAGTWDSDALSDVLAQKTDGTLWLYPGRAAGSLATGRKVGSGWGGVNLVFPVGDFGGDGFSDLMARKPDGSLTLYSGNGAGGFRGVPAKIGTGWSSYTSVFSPGDFNGDGTSDVIARASGGLLYLYPGNGSGGWLPRRTIGQGWNSFSTLLSPGDFNGDAKSDLLARRTDGTLWLYAGNGAAGFLPPARVVGTGWNTFSKILP
jgi:stage II sporulation protein D